MHLDILVQRGGRVASASSGAIKARVEIPGLVLVLNWVSILIQRGRELWYMYLFFLFSFFDVYVQVHMYHVSVGLLSSPKIAINCTFSFVVLHATTPSLFIVNSLKLRSTCHTHARV